ncbi:MAG TPA: response regulator, partial [Pyrinomonadaceae bacterium]
EAQAEGAPFTFALLELQSLRGGGVELARRIRADAKLDGTRLVLITSSVLGHDEEIEYERLFDAFLTMPMRRLQLKDHLLALVNRDQRHGVATPPGGDARPSASPGGGRTILVAEDNSVNQMLMTHLLEELGFGAVVVSNGVSALDACARGEYVMVLMDCQMPEMDGYAATAELRRREGAGRHTPVIAMTADAMPGTRERCLAAGMDDYLSKPFTREQLEDLIAKWDGRRVVRAAESTSPEEDAPVDEVLDLSLIERLHGFRERGDVGALARLIDTFLQDINARRDAISEAYGSRDREKVRREAHALKGSAGFFGAVRLSKVCAELIDPATGDDLPIAREVLKRLDDELIYVTRKLEAWRCIHPA